MSFLKGLKKFGKGIGNAALSVGSQLAPMAGMVAGGMYGGPMGAAAGQALGGAASQAMRGGKNRRTQGNPNNFMPGQENFGNVPMNQMGNAMGQQFGGQLSSRMPATFKPFGEALGQIGGMYAQNQMNKYIPQEYQSTSYGQLPQQMAQQVQQAGQNYLQQRMPEAQRPGQQNRAAFNELPFAGGYARGGRIAYNAGGSMPYGYSGGGQIGLRELADLIAQATSQMDSMGAGEESGMQTPSY